MNKKINIVIHILVCVATLAFLMLINWLGLKFWFNDNVMPLYYELIDEYMWSSKCCIYNTILTVFSVLLTSFAVLRASSYRKPNKAWWNWMIAFLAFSVVIPITLVIVYPLDAQWGIYLVEWLYCIFATAGQFFFITYLAPYQLGFNPFKH